MPNSSSNNTIFCQGLIDSLLGLNNFNNNSGSKRITRGRGRPCNGRYSNSNRIR